MNKYDKYMKINPEEKKSLAEGNFLKGYNCTQAVTLAFASELKLPIEFLAKLSSGFGGGFSRLREICGTISSATIILGILYGYADISDINLKINHYQRIQEISLAFKKEFNSYLCYELLNKPHEVESFVPSPRNESYYQKRNCSKYCGYMAFLIAKYINDHPIDI